MVQKTNTKKNVLLPLLQHVSLLWPLFCCSARLASDVPIFRFYPSWEPDGAVYSSRFIA